MSQRERLIYDASMAEKKRGDSINSEAIRIVAKYRGNDPVDLIESGGRQRSVSESGGEFRWGLLNELNVANKISPIILSSVGVVGLMVVLVVSKAKTTLSPVGILLPFPRGMCGRGIEGGNVGLMNCGQIKEKP